MDFKSCRKFIISRFARIYPAYFLAFVLAFILSLYILQNNESFWFKTLHINNSSEGFVSAFFSNLFMLQSYIPNSLNGFFNPVSWTISTEFFFYIAFPLFVFMVFESIKQRTSGLFLVFLLVTILISHGRIFEFFIGAILGLFYLKTITRRRLIGLVLVFTAVVSVYSIVKSPDYNGLLFYLTTTFGFSLLIYLLASVKMENGILALLGKVSYSIYLFHFIPLILLNYLKYIGHDFVSGFTGLGLLTATVAFSIFTYRYYEDPLRNKIKSLIN